MKLQWFFLLLLVCSFHAVTAQSDFETRYFTINATSLPELDELTSFSLTKTNVIFNTKLPTFQVTTQNYYQPVNMEAVVYQSGFYNQEPVVIQPIQFKKEEKGNVSFQITQDNSYNSYNSYRQNLNTRPFGGLDFYSPYYPYYLPPPINNQKNN